MALQRPVSKALACYGCQQWILRSFIAATGGAPALRHLRPELQSRRPVSITHRRRNENQPKEREEEHPLNEINDSLTSQPPPNPTQSIPTQEESPAPKPQNDLPWYLQQAPPIPRQNNPLQSRQQLPPLPSHPPPLLQPLLSHLSLELGLDDLNLLDLRSLDPPPALGANLLMIVGTARSEKHLHVTADRLCRWLRSEHGLKPHADGLLGRNELKLKLKRRAKRSKLLSAVGAKATAQTEIDDGIRTGWVCVNVGRVEGGEVVGEGGGITGQLEQEGRGEVVGFGPAEGGCSVVVQLMTEEKRGKVELEALWEENLGRARRKRDREGAVQEVEEGDGEVAESSTEPSIVPEQHSAQAGSGYHPFSPVSNQSVGQAVRAYHTSARRLHASAATEVSYAQDLHLPSSTQPREEQADTTSSTEKLESMLFSLKTQNQSSILETLGPTLLTASSDLTLDKSTQPNDTESTPFLERFYASMPTYPNPEHWHHHIALLSLARRAGHPEAHSPVLLAQLRNMQIAGLVPLERTFQLVVESVLAPLGPWDRRRYMSTPSASASASASAPSSVSAKASRPSDAKLAAILAVLEDMEGCGYDAVQPAILSPLYAACVGAEAEGVEMKVSSPESFKSIVRRFQLARLEGLARKQEWEEFWRVWRSYPARFLPRTGEVYAVLFSAIGRGYLTNEEGDGATSGDKSAHRERSETQQKGYDMRETIEVVRSTLEEMENEQPAVRVEDSEALAKAVMSALEFVEPELKGARAEARGMGREWFGWYERCSSVVGRDGVA